MPVPLDELLAGELGPVERALAWASACGWRWACSRFVRHHARLPGRPPAARPGSHAGAARHRGLAGSRRAPVLRADHLNHRGNDRAGGRRPEPLRARPRGGVLGPGPEPGRDLRGDDGRSSSAVSLALVVRYRRSAGIERLRYRWLVAAITLAATVTLIWAVTSIAWAIQSDLVWIVVVIGYPCVPVAIAVAVLRYRLFEIDRIISRTIAYAVVTAVVGAVFGAGIVLLVDGLRRRSRRAQTIAVAGSTLLAYAIFQPVHASRPPRRRSAVRPGSATTREADGRGVRRPAAPRDRRGRRDRRPGDDDASRGRPGVRCRSGCDRATRRDDAPATARSTRSSSGRDRTAWPRRSRWPVPGARSASTRRPRRPAAGRGRWS